MATLLSLDSLSTFRDPAGSIEIRPDAAYRHVNPAYAPDILAFLESPIAVRLTASGHLISTEILEVPSPDEPDAPLLLRHPRIAFPSYPSEWSPALWLSAAELTLNLCTDLLQEGWILKDATPLNILFQGVRPIFVDLLSIQRVDLTQPIWFAYGQFVRTFLLPMLAHTRLGWPLQIALSRRDGIEPEEVYAALTWGQRLSQPALTSVTLPILLSKRSAKSTPAPPRTVSDPEVTRHVLLKTFSTLRDHMRRVTPAPQTSNWSEYVNTANHYSQQDHDSKQIFVRSALSVSNPSYVLDVGCNTGTYSKLAAAAGASVVSIDTDLETVDRLAIGVEGTPANILPLCVDLAHPTPSIGWQNSENASFLARCTGHFDTAMMLAVIHHLLLRSQIPLPRIAALCTNLTTRNLIIEWVPPTDIMFQQLLRGREALYTHLTEAAFREAFTEHFTILRELTLPNRRILFHLERKTP